MEGIKFMCGVELEKKSVFRITMFINHNMIILLWVVNCETISGMFSDQDWPFFFVLEEYGSKKLERGLGSLFALASWNYLLFLICVSNIVLARHCPCGTLELFWNDKEGLVHLAALWKISFELFSNDKERLLHLAALTQRARLSNRDSIQAKLDNNV